MFRVFTFLLVTAAACTLTSGQDVGAQQPKDKRAPKTESPKTESKSSSESTKTAGEYYKFYAERIKDGELKLINGGKFVIPEHVKLVRAKRYDNGLLVMTFGCAEPNQDFKFEGVTAECLFQPINFKSRNFKVSGSSQTEKLVRPGLLIVQMDSSVE